MSCIKKHSKKLIIITLVISILLMSFTNCFALPDFSNNVWDNSTAIIPIQGQSNFGQYKELDNIDYMSMSKAASMTVRYLLYFGLLAVAMGLQASSNQQLYDLGISLVDRLDTTGDSLRNNVLHLFDNGYTTPLSNTIVQLRNMSTAFALADFNRYTYINLGSYSNVYKNLPLNSKITYQSSTLFHRTYYFNVNGILINTSLYISMPSTNVVHIDYYYKTEYDDDYSRLFGGNADLVNNPTLTNFVGSLVVHGAYNKAVSISSPQFIWTYNSQYLSNALTLSDNNFFNNIPLSNRLVGLSYGSVYNDYQYNPLSANTYALNDTGVLSLPNNLYNSSSDTVIDLDYLYSSSSVWSTSSSPSTPSVDLSEINQKLDSLDYTIVNQGSVINNIDSNIDNLQISVSQGFQGLRDLVSTGFSNLSSGLSGIGSAISSGISSIGAKIDTIIQSLANPITSQIETISARINDYLEVIGEYQRIGGLFSHFLPQPVAQFCMISLEVIFLIFILKLIFTL